MLGQREPEIYGHQTLSDLQNVCRESADHHSLQIDFRQTNHEGELVEWIQQAKDKASALIINAAAFTHSSVAVHDALKLLDIPVVEVHLSNPGARESFRHHSYVTPAADAVIAGLGFQGYLYAIEWLADRV